MNSCAPSRPFRTTIWAGNLALARNGSFCKAGKLSITGAYWQPGKWFKYACIDRSVEDWSDGGAGVSWGINPNPHH